MVGLRVGLPVRVVVPVALRPAVLVHVADEGDDVMLGVKETLGGLETVRDMVRVGDTYLVVLRLPLCEAERYPEVLLLAERVGLAVLALVGVHEGPNDSDGELVTDFVGEGVMTGEHDKVVQVSVGESVQVAEKVGVGGGLVVVGDGLQL